MPISSKQIPSTIAEAELIIQKGLEGLRDAPLNDLIISALSFVAPEGYRIVVQLEEDGRKKRSTASISNWNHETGEIVMYFEPIGLESASASSLKAAPLQPDYVANSHSVTSTALPALPQVEVQDQEIKECCELLAEAEKQGRQFYAIKWFRDTFLADRELKWTSTLQDRQRVLNRAIQDGYIETRSIPNPKNPAFPTTTLQLNREKSRLLLGSRFRPIATTGELASDIIIRERGRS